MNEWNKLLTHFRGPFARCSAGYFDLIQTYRESAYSESNHYIKKSVHMESHIRDFFEETIYSPVTRGALKTLDTVRKIQTGKVNSVPTIHHDNSCPLPRSGSPDKVMVIYDLALAVNALDVAKDVLGVLQVCSILALAPLMTGIMRKVKARTQKRRGSSVIQPYYELLKPDEERRSCL